MRGSAALDAVRTAARRRPLLLDLAIAVALAAFIELEILASDVSGPLGALVLLGLLATLPIVVRRRAPVIALVLVLAGVIALDEVSRVQEPQSTLLPYLLVVYSVAAHAERTTALVGLAVALTGITIDAPGDVIVLGPLSVAAWLVGRLVRDWRRQAGRLTVLADRLERERAGTARLAVAEERTRIARELHDVVGHGLSLLVLQAGAERMALRAAGSERRTAVEEIERSGRATLAELRRLVGVLRREDDLPDLAPLPGLAELPELADKVRAAGLPVDLRVPDQPIALPAGLDLSAYRIVQEALTNAVRHATGATGACVRIGSSARELVIEVTDDGKPAGGVGPDGHGVIGMRERVALFGGQLQAGPRPDRGWSVCARLPLDGEAR